MRFLPRTRLGVLWRAGIAALLVIGFAAGATAAAGLLQVKQIVGEVDLTPPIRDAGVSLPAPGQPQTFLLIGADHRYGQPGGVGNTDTMLLVRINDSSKTINMLSVPRDLQVQLPAGPNGAPVAEKLNAAYSLGGPRLLLQTLKTQVFPGLRVNNILVSSFAGFADLVNQIGCVYLDIDQRYYNFNNGNPNNDYSAINLQPGYQKLCGGHGSDLGGADTALAFVRFRHTDDDEVRNARQQDFIRWVRDQYSLSYLISHRQSLLTTFFKNTQATSSLHTSDGIIEFGDLLLNADGLELKTIPFPERFGPCGGGGQTPCYVFATSRAAEQQAYRELMTPTSSVPPVGHVRLGNPAPQLHRRHGHGHGPRGGFHAPAGMVADPAAGRAQAAALARPGLPVYYPSLVPGNYQYCSSSATNCNNPYEPPSAYAGSYPRSYTIDGYGGRRYPAYALTLSLGAPGGLAETGDGQFLAVQGTTWQDPPILKEHALLRRVNGKLLHIYSQGGQISTVAWHTHGAVYWIQNNLQRLVPNDQMVTMAATLTRARG